VLQISTRLSLIHYTMGLRLYNDGGWEQAEDHVRALTDIRQQPVRIAYAASSDHYDGGMEPVPNSRLVVLQMSTAIEYNPQVAHYYAVRGKIYYYK
jgi:hypothetical protein